MFQKYDGENDTGYNYYHRVDAMSGGDQNPTNTTGFTTASEGGGQQRPRQRTSGIELIPWRATRASGSRLAQLHYY